MNVALARVTTALLSSLALIAATTPGAAAGPGWITDGEGGLYRLDTATGTVSPQAQTGVSFNALAAHRDAVLGLTGGGGAAELVSLDVDTGAVDPVGALEAAGFFSGLTSTAGGAVYASGYASDGVSGVSGQLYRVDPADASLTPLGEATPDEALVTLAGACGGGLLGVDLEHQLVRVDRTTGEQVAQGLIQTEGDEIVQALAFEHATRTLWALITSGSQERLVHVDPGSGAVTPSAYLPGQIGPNAFALAFDSPAACRYERSVSLAYSARRERFSGRLRSGYAPCAAGQQVRVLRTAPGPDVRLGKATTGPDGRFTVRARLARGSAYAVAPRSVDERVGVCLAARSPSVR